MPVIRTKTNRVIAEDPEADDLFVRVSWLGAHEDGRHLRAFDGPVEPIENYRGAIDWAVSMADDLRFPLFVVPMTGIDALRSDSVKRAVANLTDQERGELRQLVVTTMAELMRDCDQSEVRADAFDVLADMGVVKL